MLSLTQWIDLNLPSLQYKALAPMYYRGAAAAIVVYDITSESTFNCMKNWVKELSQFGPKDIKIAVAGNKCDLEDAREVNGLSSLPCILLGLAAAYCFWFNRCKILRVGNLSGCGLPDID